MSQVCSHCEGYVAERDGLCGNCLLLSPERREAESKFKKQLSEGRKRADAAARKAFEEEMGRLPHDPARGE